jgi:hypothetical protein
MLNALFLEVIKHPLSKKKDVECAPGYLHLIQDSPLTLFHEALPYGRGLMVAVC